MSGFRKYLSKEDLMQEACVNYVKYQYPSVLFFHVPNEGKRTKYQRMVVKVLGTKAGVSDLIFLEPKHEFHGMALELKVKPNKPSKAQSDFLKECTAKGYLAKVIYSFEEFKECVDKYFGEE